MKTCLHTSQVGRKERSAPTSATRTFTSADHHGFSALRTAAPFHGPTQQSMPLLCSQARQDGLTG